MSKINVKQLRPGTNGQVVSTVAGLVAWADSSGGSSSSIKESIAQTAHGFVVGDVLKRSSGTYAKAQASSAANADAVGVVESVTDANTFVIVYQGRITGLSGLTDATAYFLSATTAGLLTDAEPNTIGTVSKPMLVATGTTTGIVLNLRGMLNDGDNAPTNLEDAFAVMLSDETTDITVGTAKATLHAPYAFSLLKVKFGLTTSSSSGLPTIDVNVNGVSIFTTRPTIDVGERFSDLAVTPSVLTSTPYQIASGDVITIDIDVAGVGAKGAKVYFLGNKNGPF